ncbi:Ntn hydrolase family protein [Loigolactobacillus zhaoyuanensis]|uniref:Uncharacterized protein n=1 Tax=Loigolactobacillus zhaoyuanensis TaxID=2486017 RepID=A0ABW8U8Y7_9LACO|nr:hypothetical protein [Loigolactobacillus zhaoyuanensis]
MTIAIGISNFSGSIIATDSRLTMPLDHHLHVTSDHTQKIFRVNNCLVATAGQYNLKFDYHWLTVKEFLLNFAARHPDLADRKLAMVLQQEISTTDLANNDFIMATGSSIWQITQHSLAMTNYTAIGQPQAVDYFNHAYCNASRNLPITQLAAELPAKLTHLIETHPQIRKIGGPIQIACIGNKMYENPNRTSDTNLDMLY